jgi:hypothetical protein
VPHVLSGFAGLDLSAFASFELSAFASFERKVCGSTRRASRACLSGQLLALLDRL